MNHNDVRTFMQNRHRLDPIPADVRDHLASCADCQAFADTLTHLRSAPKSPYAEESLSAPETRDLVQSLLPQIRTRNYMQQQIQPNTSSIPKFAGAFAMLALILMGSVFWFSNRSGGSASQPAVSGTEDILHETNSLDYDGWELGVAANLPDGWRSDGVTLDHTGDDGAVLRFGTHELPQQGDLDAIAALPDEFQYASLSTEPLPSAGTNPPSAEQAMRLRYGDSDIISEIATIGNKTVAISTQAPVDYPDLAQIAMSTVVNGRTVHLIGLSQPDNTDTLRTNLDAIIASLQTVDYSGWIQRSNSSGVTIGAPQGWTDEFDGDANIELVENRRDTVTETDGLRLPRINVSYGFKSDYGDTLNLNHVDAINTIVGNDLTLVTKNSPTTIIHRPDIMRAEYTIEGSDNAYFIATINHSFDRMEGKSILVEGLVSADEAEAFAPLFYRVVRSLGGEPMLSILTNPVYDVADQVPAVMVEPDPTVVPREEVEALEENLPLLGGSFITFESWSPDSRYAAFWVSDQENVNDQQPYSSPGGRLHFYDSQTQTTCAVVEMETERAFSAELIWETNTLYTLHYKGTAWEGRPCQFFQETELVEREVIAPDPRHFPGVCSREEGCPFIETTFQKEGTSDNGLMIFETIMFSGSGEELHSLTWSIDRRKDDYTDFLGGEWASPTQFIIYETANQGPLLIDETEGITPILPTYYDITSIPTLVEDNYTYRVQVIPSDQTDQFHLLASSEKTIVKLYHAELDLVEALPSILTWNPAIVDDWIILSTQAPDSQDWNLMRRQIDDVDGVWSSFALNTDFTLWDDANSNLAWTKEGKSIVWQDWQTGRIKFEADYPESQMGLYATAFSPDGEQLAIIGQRDGWDYTLYFETLE